MNNLAVSVASNILLGKKVVENDVNILSGKKVALAEKGKEAIEHGIAQNADLYAVNMQSKQYKLSDCGTQLLPKTRQAIST